MVVYQSKKKNGRESQSENGTNEIGLGCELRIK
jgi:hypothetical protein